jgi:large subunit ribosomal protein L25
MADVTLNAQKREGTGKGVARQLRLAGRVPAVLYGREFDAVHLSVDAHEATLLFHSISTENTILALDVEGDKEPYRTLVREIQTHPWKGSLIHIDFLRIQKGVMVDVEVPIHLIGTPVGVKNDGGIVEQVIHEIAVRCIPSKIPKSIDVDISHLDVNESLHVSDVEFGEGVEVMIDQANTICAVAIPRAVAAADGAEEGEEGGELDEGGVPLEGEEGGDEA